MPGMLGAALRRVNRGNVQIVAIRARSLCWLCLALTGPLCGRYDTENMPLTVGNVL